MDKITYSIIGAGWRAEFYLRIAKLMADRFCVACVCVRNQQKALEIAEKYNVKTVKTIEELKAVPCDFIVNCINKNDISYLSLELAEEGFAVLAETPACTDKEQAQDLLSRYKESYKIQIAEQFRLKPVYQAMKNIINKGIIGDPRYIHVSAAHNYHAMSLIRFFTEDVEPVTDTPPVKIADCCSVNPVLHTHYRNGELDDKEIKSSAHTVKVFGFVGKTAVYDFDHEQYFSPIRTDRILIRGDRGEIENDTVRYFNKNNEFAESRMLQHKSGNLDGMFNGNITFEGEVIYKPRFGDARISDEETAVAEVLVRMQEYVKTGKEFYSFRDGVKDVLWFD